MDPALRAIRKTALKLRLPKQEGVALILLMMNFGPRNAVAIYSGLVAKGWSTVLAAVFTCISVKGYTKLLEMVFGKRLASILIVATITPAILLKPDATDGPTSSSLSDERTSINSYGLAKCIKSIVHEPVTGSDLLTSWGTCSTYAFMSIGTVNGCTLIGIFGVWINITTLLVILRSTHPIVGKLEQIFRQLHQTSAPAFLQQDVMHLDPIGRPFRSN
eukprot:TRINITY_DN34446_c0_g1_i1.p1 TRINITY_DN34446_c0_g1~~TRINITY_DN34446_c0_g1_i1.p1  ORF type:complete len:218 (+),score=20.92 TRINITY_DN34446_c0_g1_i1:72-725(+)